MFFSLICFVGISKDLAFKAVGDYTHANLGMRYFFLAVHTPILIPLKHTIIGFVWSDWDGQ